MITLTFAFVMLVVLFAVIGAVRGWAKEVLVTFSAILGLFIIAILQRFAPTALRSLLLSGETSAFWIQTGIFLFLNAKTSLQNFLIVLITFGRSIRSVDKPIFQWFNVSFPFVKPIGTNGSCCFPCVA
jgi:uncharacterized membrane protein required for colicin V production